MGIGTTDYQFNQKQANHGKANDINYSFPRQLLQKLPKFLHFSISEYLFCFTPNIVSHLLIRVK